MLASIPLLSTVLWPKRSMFYDHFISSRTKSGEKIWPLENRMLIKNEELVQKAWASRLWKLSSIEAVHLFCLVIPVLVFSYYYSCQTTEWFCDVNRFQIWAIDWNCKFIFTCNLTHIWTRSPRGKKGPVHLSTMLLSPCSSHTSEIWDVSGIKLELFWNFCTNYRFL